MIQDLGFIRLDSGFPIIFPFWKRVVFIFGLASTYDGGNSTFRAAALFAAGRRILVRLRFTSSQLRSEPHSRALSRLAWGALYLEFGCINVQYQHSLILKDKVDMMEW